MHSQRSLLSPHAAFQAGRQVAATLFILVTIAFVVGSSGVRAADLAGVLGVQFFPGDKDKYRLYYGVKADPAAPVVTQLDFDLLKLTDAVHDLLHGDGPPRINEILSYATLSASYRFFNDSDTKGTISASIPFDDLVFGFGQFAEGDFDHAWQTWGEDVLLTLHASSADLAIKDFPLVGDIPTEFDLRYPGKDGGFDGSIGLHRGFAGIDLLNFTGIGTSSAQVHVSFISEPSTATLLIFVLMIVLFQAHSRRRIGKSRLNAQLT